MKEGFHVPVFHPWLLTPVFLLGISYGHSPWDRKESDTTERLTHALGGKMDGGSEDLTTSQTSSR